MAYLFGPQWIWAFEDWATQRGALKCYDFTEVSLPKTGEIVLTVATKHILRTLPKCKVEQEWRSKYIDMKEKYRHSKREYAKLQSEKQDMAQGIFKCFGIKNQNLDDFPSFYFILQSLEFFFLKKSFLYRGDGLDMLSLQERSRLHIQKSNMLSGN